LTKVVNINEGPNLSRNVDPTRIAIKVVNHHHNSTNMSMLGKKVTEQSSRYRWGVKSTNDHYGECNIARTIMIVAAMRKYPKLI
jgi:hypothetical protein